MVSSPCRSQLSTMLAFLGASVGEAQALVNEPLWPFTDWSARGCRRAGRGFTAKLSVFGAGCNVPNTRRSLQSFRHCPVGQVALREQFHPRGVLLPTVRSAWQPLAHANALEGTAAQSRKVNCLIAHTSHCPAGGIVICSYLVSFQGS